VFNIGIRIESMDAAKRFYCGALGFEVLSENHPPPIIPLKPRGSAPLILFEGIPARAADGAEVARSVLVLETSDLAAVLAGLRQRGLEVPGDGAKEVLLEDPSGNRIKLRQAGG
jgi:catechol 2,3-dioxygenase-like lactoylglutathione lyase family enzyme